jgi:hypothetical protein
VNKRWDLTELKAALLEYQAKTRERSPWEWSSWATGTPIRRAPKSFCAGSGLKGAGQYNLLEQRSGPPLQGTSKAQLKAFSEHLASQGLICVRGCTGAGASWEPAASSATPSGPIHSQLSFSIFQFFFQALFSRRESRRTPAWANKAPFGLSQAP